MGRKKLPLKLISNKRARIVSFEKRKKCLKKAAYELSTLCGVDIGMVICNCESNESEVWPPMPGTVARMIELYESSSGQDWRCRTYGLADYIKEEREKEKKAREKMGKDACGSLSRDQLRELGDLLNAKIGAVREKISLMKAEPDVLMKTEPVVLMNNLLLQESGVLALTNAWQQQQQAQHWAYLDPDQEKVVFAMNNAGQQQQQQQQQHWACFNPDQEKVVFATNNAGQQQQQQYLTYLDSDQENVVFATNNAGQQLQQQHWACFDSDQENVVFATNAGQQQMQHWTYFDQGQVFMYPSLQESGGLATNSGQKQQQLWKYFDAQESGVLATNAGQQQQQNWTYFN